MISITISAVSAIIALASAYFAWRATRPVPQLLARITTVWELAGDDDSSLLLVHFQVTNRATLPVQLLSYQLSLKLSDETEVPAVPWSSLDRELAFGFSLSGGSHFDVVFRDASFANWPPNAVGYGEALLGWLPFKADRTTVDAVHTYVFTFFDALGGKWKASITRAESDLWRREQQWRTPNMIDLLRYSGVEVACTNDEADCQPST